MVLRILKELISWILIIAMAFLIAQIITRIIILRVIVPTGSMEDTIMVDNKVVAFRLSYLISDPKRGDIIVFPFPDDEKVDYIKRIIGLPGDKVEGKAGLVYINGEPLEETYVMDSLDSDFGPYTVPKDSYFMMGDNRNASKDSRYWVNKYVKREKIIGKAILKYPSFAWLIHRRDSKNSAGN